MLRYVVLPAVLPARRAYGCLAQEVGGASRCPPSCPPSCPLGACSEPKPIIWVSGTGGSTPCQQHAKRVGQTTHYMVPKMTLYPKTELLGVVLQRCNFAFRPARDQVAVTWTSRTQHRLRQCKKRTEHSRQVLLGKKKTFA